TMGFRKIFGQTKTLDGNNAVLSWNLKDQWGIPLADGLYYVRIQVTGPASGSRIIKVLVLQ
ncbi:MAG TPA: hypothetical protein VJ873_08785, partial [bacterium]|nr:hypothetical protein [bacterium]